MNNVTLTTDEAKALTQVSSHLVIPDDMRANLTKKGLVKQLLGGLAITQKGKDYIQGRR